MLTLGAVAWLALNGLHGELPGTAREAVERLDGALWRPIHMLTIVAIFVVAAGLALVTGAFTPPWAFVLGRAGTMMAVPAAAVLGVGFAIDGFVLPALAEMYASAPDEAARMMHIMQADVVLHVIGATSFAYQTLFGMAIAVLAVATLLERNYPGWLCWLGLVGGVIWGVAALLDFAHGPGAGTAWILVPALPVAIWMICVGWLTWRSGRALGASSISDQAASAT
jgi:hypothetical protein